jgi:Zn-finger nucleic acid-binding protein
VCEDQQLAISSREGVEIDYCPQCRGVWLDRGELDKIIDRVADGGGAAVASAPPPPPRQEDRRYEERHEDRPYDDRRPDKRRKRRSFLDDIFDFD